MRKWWWSSLVIFLFQFVIWKVIANNQFISNWWFNSIILKYNEFISSITSKLSIPLGEILYLGIFFNVLHILLQFIQIRKLKPITFRLFIILNGFIFIYQSIWGMGYYKQTFITNDTELKVEEDKVKELYCNYLNKANYYRGMLSNQDTIPLKFSCSINEYLDDFKESQSHLQNEHWIQNYKILKQPRVKNSSISNIQNQIGILGYYNPFTIESNVNVYNTSLKKPFTLAHELAHQMGFASENEANFIAYYFGIHSNLPEVQYAAYYKTSFSLLFSLSAIDPLFVMSELESLPKGIKTDREHEIAYYAKFEGKTNDAFSVLNDQFLKANNQEGTISYSKYIELVYYYEYEIKKGSIR